MTPQYKIYLSHYPAAMCFNVHIQRLMIPDDGPQYTELLALMSNGEHRWIITSPGVETPPAFRISIDDCSQMHEALNYSGPIKGKAADMEQIVWLRQIIEKMIFPD